MRSSTVAVALLLVALAAMPALAKPTPQQRCAAAKHKAVGALHQCLEKAAAAAVLTRKPVADAKCVGKFLKSWEKATTKKGARCADGVSGDAILAQVGECVAAAAQIVTGVAKVATCGDGRVNVSGEQCDGDDLDGATCEGLGFSGGTLGCTRDCRIDTAGCTASACTAGAAGYASPAGCTCKDTWTYAAQTFCNGQCGTPDGDPNGPWCFTTASCNGANWGYCQPVDVCTPGVAGWEPPAGCTCKSRWSYGGQTFCNGECANPDGDPNGPWCFTDTTCNGASFAYCQAP